MSSGDWLTVDGVTNSILVFYMLVGIGAALIVLLVLVVVLVCLVACTCRRVTRPKAGHLHRVEEEEAVGGRQLNEGAKYENTAGTKRSTSFRLMSGNDPETITLKENSAYEQSVLQTV